MQLLNLKVCDTFERVEKFVVYFDFYEPSLHLSRREDQTDPVYEKEI